MKSVNVSALEASAEPGLPASIGVARCITDAQLPTLAGGVGRFNVEIELTDWKFARDEVVVVIEGQLSFTSSTGERVAARKGGMLIVPADTLATVRASAGTEIVFVTPR